jgi:DNA-binding beta-propeller fold protein YncE
MRDAVIVDKRNLDESMGGWPITQARHDNGVVFTLYRGAAHPFIHALHTNEAWAICLDLPEIGADDAQAAADWGLAISTDGRAVYAVNATLGLASAIDPGELSIRNTVSFEAPQAAATITLAKFGHQEGGPVGRRVVVSPDGSTLFAAGAGGVVRLEAGALTVTGSFLEGAAVSGLGLTPDGSTLYALLGADGRIVRVDTATGDLVGEVQGDGYDRLVAVVPW